MEIPDGGGEGADSPGVLLPCSAIACAGPELGYSGQLGNCSSSAHACTNSGESSGGTGLCSCAVFISRANGSCRP